MKLNSLFTNQPDTAAHNKLRLGTSRELPPCFKSKGHYTEIINSKLLNEIESKWLASFKFDYFITLTYRYNIKSKEKVKNDLHGLHRRVSQKLFGRNAFDKFPTENCLKFVPVIESHQSGDLHIHMLVKDIDISNKFNRAEQGSVPGLILNCWRKIAHNPVQLDVREIISETDLINTCRYCLKQQNLDRNNIILDYIRN